MHSVAKVLKTKMFEVKIKYSKKCCKVSEMNFIGDSPFVSSESVNGFAKLIQSISFMFVVQLTTSCIWRILQSENVFIMAELLSSSIPLLTAKSPICDQLLL